MGNNKKSDAGELKRKTITALLWKAFEKFGSQFIQLAVTIILARLLSPEDYGTVALTMVFASLALVFIDYGFGHALIQKKDIGPLEINTTFFMSISLGIILYIILFIAAPYISIFYGDPIIKHIVRILSLILILGSVSAVQNAILSRKLEYKKIFISNSLATVISGATGIICALYNLGVWALVIQQITLRIVAMFCFAVAIKYKPKLQFSKEYAKASLFFSWKILASQLLTTLYNNIRSLLIGKIYTTADLAYYNKGEQFPGIVSVCTSFSFQNVMFSAYSRVQTDYERIKHMMKKSLVASSFVVCPAMLGLCAIAEPLIITVLGNNWIESVPYMQIICVAYSLTIPGSVSFQALNAIGRTDETLKFQVIVRCFATIMICGAVFINIYAIAFSQIIVNTFEVFLRAVPCKKYFNYGYREQIADLLPSFFNSALMSILVIMIWKQLKNSIIPVYISLFILIILAIIIYIGLALLFKNKGLEYLKESLAAIFKR